MPAFCRNATAPLSIALNSSPPIHVRDSKIHGTGVFATRKLRTGALIGFYGGRRYEAREVSERDWNHELTHVFGLADGSVIDGADGGNATRFINHSCAPNCAAYEVVRRGRSEIRIEALRVIAEGDEIFLDYSLNVGDNDVGDYPCGCGASTCRGTLCFVASAAA
jgi:SET domain-containing protein